MMGSRLTGWAFILLAGVASQPAMGAQDPEDAGKAALAQCVVLRTTGADRLLTAQWMFAAMSESPAIADLSAVTDQRKVELNKEFAKLLTRLVMNDCLEQVRPVASHNFENAFELVGRSLGEVAMQELMGNKDVDDAIGAYTEFLSEDDFKPLLDSIEKDQSK